MNIDHLYVTDDGTVHLHNFMPNTLCGVPRLGDNYMTRRSHVCRACAEALLGKHGDFDEWCESFTVTTSLHAAADVLQRHEIAYKIGGPNELLICWFQPMLTVGWDPGSGTYYLTEGDVTRKLDGGEVQLDRKLCPVSPDTDIIWQGQAQSDEDARHVIRNNIVRVARYNGLTFLVEDN